MDSLKHKNPYVRGQERALKAQKKSGPPRQILAADLFAGAGGFSKGALNVGIDVKVAVEFDKHACESYRAHFDKGDRKIQLIEGDITDIALDEVSSPFGNSGCDLVLGGPPCQGFSVHRIKGAGVSDPRNQLIHRYFDVVRHLQPFAFLMENVPGILWKRHARYLDLFYTMAEESGYTVKDPVVLDARDFGVPQRRKRVFILGTLSSLPDISVWPPLATHGDEKARETDKTLEPWLCSKIAFTPAPADDPNDVHMEHCEDLIRAFARTPIDGGSRKDSGRLLPCHKDHDGHKDVYGRIDRRKPAPTMTTACINPSKGRFVHPVENHGITVRQAARIQTFPDDFRFFGGIMAAGRQIGNAVPVRMAEAILRVIRPYIENYI